VVVARSINRGYLSGWFGDCSSDRRGGHPRDGRRKNWRRVAHGWCCGRSKRDCQSRGDISPAGQTTQATAIPKDASGNILSGKYIAWSTLNPSIATVSISAS
jgi:hypothetical protein